MKKEFVVIWSKTETKFTEFDEALEFAKDMIRNEDESSTALIIKHEFNGESVRVPLTMLCNWITGNVFELVHIM